MPSPSDEGRQLLDSGKIRCFVAIHLPEPILEAAIAFQAQLRSRDDAESVRFTEREQMHLTLKFLGSVPAASIEPLLAALSAAAAKSKAFDLSLGKFGAFPSLRRPRVLWLGFAGDLRALTDLHTHIDEASGQWSGHEENREFHPHLTLGRVRDPRSPATRALGAQLVDLEFTGAPPWTVQSFSLMKSQLSPKGAQYTQLSKFKLA